MRIAMLAGAVALAVPMGANAAVYEFKFESEIGGNSGGPAPLTASFTLDVFRIENVFYDGRLDQNGAWGERGGSLLSFSINDEYLYGGGRAVIRTDENGNLDQVFVSTYDPNYFFELSEAGLTEDYEVVYVREGSWTVTDVTPPTPALVPLPASAPLLLAGLGGLAWMRRRKA